MEFEWDQEKSRSNEQKHGISFEDAICLWDGICMEIEDLAHSNDGEKRSATLGRIGSKAYVAIWTRRGKTLRLISVRRARIHEEEIIDEKIQECKRDG